MPATLQDKILNLNQLKNCLHFPRKNKTGKLTEKLTYKIVPQNFKNDERRLKVKQLKQNLNKNM